MAVVETSIIVITVILTKIIAFELKNDIEVFVFAEMEVFCTVLRCK